MYIKHIGHIEITDYWNWRITWGTKIFPGWHIVTLGRIQWHNWDAG